MEDEVENYFLTPFANHSSPSSSPSQPASSWASESSPSKGEKIIKLTSSSARLTWLAVCLQAGNRVRSSIVQPGNAPPPSHHQQQLQLCNNLGPCQNTVRYSDRIFLGESLGTLDHTTALLTWFMVNTCSLPWYLPVRLSIRYCNWWCPTGETQRAECNKDHHTLSREWLYVAQKPAAVLTKHSTEDQIKGFPHIPPRVLAHISEFSKYVSGL